MSSIPGIELIAVENQVLLRHRAVPDRPPLDADTLKGLLKQAGYEQWFVDDSELRAVATRCNSEQQEFEAPIAERRNAQFDLELASDAMTAWIRVTPPYGGALFHIDQVVQALAGIGVVFGLDEAALLRICANPEAGRFEIAKGQPAVDGEDVRFELLVNTTRDRTPKVDANGLIDFRELGEIPVVDVGQPLMRRIPPTLGQPGRNLLAAILYPRPGRDAVFTHNLQGTTVGREDPNLLMAAVHGQPVQVDSHGVMVEQVIHFDGASMASGNIAFDGTVHIDGDVLQGMKVQAAGDVIVTGTVDGGLVDAGGSVQVQGGIIAHAVVRAGVEVSARFIENSQVEAGRSIGVDDMALQSQLQAGNQIEIGRKAAKRGRLVGGTAKAMMRISTPILGDPASSITQVMVGINPELEAAYQEAQQRLEKLHQDLDAQNKLVQHLSKQAGQADMLQRVQATLNMTSQTLADVMEHKVRLERQMELYAKARVDIGVGLAGAVDLSFGHTTRAVRRAYGSGSFSIEGGLVLFTPQGGDSSEV